MQILQFLAFTLKLSGMTTNSPLFSIVTITLNNLEGLQKTHKSLIAQTHHDYEWIVIDGGSDDGSLTYLETLDGVTFISEIDNGLYHAMNKGIQRANGTYLIFMNSGDYFAEPKVLQTIKEQTAKTSPDFIYGDALECLDGKKAYKKARHHSKIHQGMITHHQAMFYHHNLLQHLEYNQKYHIAADYDLTLKALKRAQKICYIGHPICVFESGGVSQKNVRLGRVEQFKIRRENGHSFFANVLTFIAQTVIYQLRRFAPRLYWFLKRA